MTEPEEPRESIAPGGCQIAAILGILGVLVLLYVLACFIGWLMGEGVHMR